MSTPRLPLMLVAFLLIAGLGLAWLLAHERSSSLAPGPAPRGAMNATGTGTSEETVSLAEVLPGTADERAFVGPATAVLNAGGDLHALAAESLEGAERGEMEALWSLYAALRFCENHLFHYPTRERFDRIAERLRAKALGNARSAALAEREFTMCDGFRADPIARFGASESWFEQAVLAGHPLAKLELATGLVIAWRDLNHEDVRRRTLAARGVIGTSIDHFHRVLAAREIVANGLDQDMITERVRDATIAALASGRADAMLQVALHSPRSLVDDDDQPGLDQEAMLERAALVTLACRLGHPCAPDSFWVQAFDAYSSQPLPRDAETMMYESLPGSVRHQLEDRVEELAAHHVSASWDDYWP